MTARHLPGASGISSGTSHRPTPCSITRSSSAWERSSTARCSRRPFATLARAARQGRAGSVWAGGMRVQRRCA